MRKISINFNKNNLDEKIQTVKAAFCKDLSFEYEFDLSRLNLIDASKTALILSAELMKKNTNSKINCLLKDKETYDIIAPRKLKNTFLSVTVNNNTREIQYRNIGIKDRKRYC